MARHLWSVLCSRSSRDEDTEELSLTTLDRIIVHVPPGVDAPAHLALKCVLISFWSKGTGGEADGISVRISLYSPEGEQLGRSPNLSLVFIDRRARLRFVSSSQPFRGAGAYEYTVESRRGDEDWQEHARLPLEVRVEDVLPGQTVAESDG